MYASLVLLLPCRSADLIETSQRSQTLNKPSSFSQKRKRGQEEEYRIRDQPPPKRTHVSPPSWAAAGVLKKTKKWKKASVGDVHEEIDPLEYWILTQKWPKEYFEQHDQIIQKDLERDSGLEERMEKSNPPVQYIDVNGLRLPCPIRKVPTSLRRKQSDSSLNDSCDQTNRERKSAPYRTTQYTTLLEGKGSYMYKSDLGITKASKDLYQRLLGLEQAVPKDSLFRDDLFEKTCRKIEDRNEAKVIQDIARLIVPSAENLAVYGATHLEHLIEGVNESWSGSIPIAGPRPQPDYCVGFRRSAFTNEQLKKLDPLIGSVFENSLFIATYRIYFPFLTCEVKCGASALDIADRQNAHSMTVAVRALIELFRSVRREKELNREILAFSISHDHRLVRIYGHYPVIEEDKITFYRHPIHEFSFIALDGKEKWTTYKFIKNIYDHYSPKIHQLICSAIDDLPIDISFDLSQSTVQDSQRSNVDSVLNENYSQSSIMTSRQAMSITSSKQMMEPEFKKSRKKRAGGQ